MFPISLTPEPRPRPSAFHRLAATLFLIAAVSACSFLSPTAERYVACSYDTAWETTLETLEDYPIDTKDKHAGVIETGWVEQPVQGRPYGLFQREGLGDKERFQTMVTLERRPEFTVVRISERREHFGFRGGARLYQWYPVEPSEQAIQALMGRLTTQLEEQGCFVGT